MGSAKKTPDPGGFWDDSGRYGFGAALRRRVFGFSIGETRWRWGALLAQDERALLGLLRQALECEQANAACWVFEAMIACASGELAPCVGALGSLLPRNDEAAASALAGLLPAIERPSELLKLSLSVREAYLFGLAYVERAKTAQGKRQEQLEADRSVALQFLERARELAPLEQQERLAQGAQRAVQQTAYPYSDERLAASYEQAMYLVWVPPASASSGTSSSTGDGG